MNQRLLFWLSVFSVALQSCTPTSLPTETSKSAKVMPSKLDFQTDPYFAKIDNERGAVLCSWLIVIDLKATSETCHQGRNQPLDDALQKSLDDITSFVVANSSRKAEEFKASTSLQLSLAKAEAICTGDATEFYKNFTSSGEKGIHEWTSKLLEIPRPPVMNPCL
jgi:hypothetical protein